jgi:isopentenyl-diphosphate Delta-isomerase
MEQVILVDSSDRERGTMEKMKAHLRGELHRAFSVFLFNAKGEMLLQRRAGGKYHSAGLWSNACCSHPRPGEDTRAAAERRLKEELGIEEPLEFRTSFVYRVAFENGLVEHEFDHVFTGTTSKEPILNLHEADAWRWCNLHTIRQEIAEDPDAFTSWFVIAIREIF